MHLESVVVLVDFVDENFRVVVAGQHDVELQSARLVPSFRQRARWAINTEVT